jgi:hypothetical protein
VVESGVKIDDHIIQNINSSLKNYGVPMIFCKLGDGTYQFRLELPSGMEMCIGRVYTFAKLYRTSASSLINSAMFYYRRHQLELNPNFYHESAN